MYVHLRFYRFEKVERARHLSRFPSIPLFTGLVACQCLRPSFLSLPPPGAIVGQAFHCLRGVIGRPLEAGRGQIRNRVSDPSRAPRMPRANTRPTIHPLARFIQPWNEWREEGEGTKGGASPSAENNGDWTWG